jgi:hypothetical protein
MGTPGALVSEQRLDMGGVFDLLTAVEAARVIGDRLMDLDDADPI